MSDRIPTDHKRCSRCKEVKHIYFFNSDPRKSKGRNCYCRLCLEVYHKERYQRKKAERENYIV